MVDDMRKVADLAIEADGKRRLGKARTDRSGQSAPETGRSRALCCPFRQGDRRHVSFL